MVNALIAVFVLLAVILPGLLLSGDRQEFFLAGRKASAPIIAASLLATCLGSSATVGIVARAYQIGWPAFWWLGAGGIGLMLLGLFWVEPMRQRDSTQTLPQWAEVHYGLPARVLAAVLIALMWTLVIAAQWTAAATILAAIAGWNTAGALVLSALGVTLYTARGGQRSVLKTDLWQLGFVLAAIVLPLAFLRRLPDRATSGLPGPAAFGFSAEFTILNWFSLMVVVGGMYLVGPDLCSRVLVARSSADARRGALIAGPILILCSLAIVAVGVTLRDSGVAIENPNQALPWLIKDSGILPKAVGYLVNFGLLAAMLSSADTCLLTAASVLELDLVGRTHAKDKRERMGRAFVCGVGLVSLVVAWFKPEIIPNVLLAYTFYAGGLLVPLILLGFPRIAARVPRPWIWTAMAAGGSLPVILMLTGNVGDDALAGLYGVGVCLAICLAGMCVPGAGNAPANG